MQTQESATQVIERRNVGVSYGQEQIAVYFNIVSDLTASISDLSRQVKELREAHDKEHKIIYVKEIPFDEAKESVFKIIKESKTDGIETLDIAEKACLSVDIVFEAIKKLQEEGRIGKVD